MTRTPPRRSAAAVALAGLVALAVAMGIGRFAFTPILPMMQEDAGVSIAMGGWLASSNYLGYLLGALSVMWPVVWSGIAAIMIAALFVGGTFMVITMVGMQEARDVAGTHATGLMAALTSAFALGQIVGPVIVSYVVAASGSFSVALMIASAVLVVSAYELS